MSEESEILRRLMKSDGMTQVEFSERSISAHSEKRHRHKMSGGFEISERSERSDRSDRSDRSERRQRNHGRQPTFSMDGGDNSDDFEVDIDYLFTAADERKRGNHQSGGADMNEIERDFFAIFNSAKEYGKRIEDLANSEKKRMTPHQDPASVSQAGGDDGWSDEYDSLFMGEDDEFGLDSQFGGANAKFALIGEIANSILKMKIKDAEIKQAGLMSIASAIIREAESNVSNKNDMSAISAAAKKIANGDISKYITAFKNRPKKPKKERKSKKSKDKTSESNAMSERRTYRKKNYY